jgi:hypothetical protein
LSNYCNTLWEKLIKTVDYHVNSKAKQSKLVGWYFLISLPFLLSRSLEFRDFESEQQSISTNSFCTSQIDTNLWLKKTRGIRDILEDNQGNFWFSSPDYVAKFDGKYWHYFSETDGLEITGNIHKDDSGIIWIENGFRAFKYDGENFLEEKIESIKDADGLWFQRGLDPSDTAFIQPGLYSISRKANIFHPLPIPKRDFNKFLHLPSSKAILSKDSTIWLATMNKVYGYKNHQFISIGREEMGRQNDERQMGIRGIFIDSKGTLWMADNGAGIFTYRNGQVENFTKKHALDEGDTTRNTLHRAFSIAEDTDGNMWFGTVYSGIWMYCPKTNQLENFSYDEGVRSENIWTIYKTKAGQLLFAGESPGAVYTFNGETFKRKY